MPCSAVPWVFYACSPCGCKYPHFSCCCAFVSNRFAEVVLNEDALHPSCLLVQAVVVVIIQAASKPAPVDTTTNPAVTECRSLGCILLASSFQNDQEQLHCLLGCRMLATLACRNHRAMNLPCWQVPSAQSSDLLHIETKAGPCSVRVYTSAVSVCDLLQADLHSIDR